MPLPRMVEGWAVHYEPVPGPGHPFARLPDQPAVVLQKGKEWAVSQGRVGIDPEILYQRALIAALHDDLTRATSDEERARLTRAVEVAVVQEREGVAERVKAQETHARRVARADIPPLPPTPVPVPVSPIPAPVAPAPASESLGERVKRWFGGA